MEDLFDAILEGLFGSLFTGKKKAPIEPTVRLPREELLACTNAYHRWATEHGLAWSGQKNHAYVGTHLGIGIEMTTGIDNAPDARSPSLYLRCVLREGDPAVVAMRALPGVWKVVLASDLVQVRFDPCTPTTAFDAVLGALPLSLTRR